MLLLLFSGTKVSHRIWRPRFWFLRRVDNRRVIEYSQTIGETAVETVSSAGFILTQGFQQPRYNYNGNAPKKPEWMFIRIRRQTILI